MKNELISVIIPVYKVEKYLNRCIESIINQTYKNLEIILVDDGSPDNCPKMCDEWANKNSRIKVIHKPNGGVSSARNLGITHATGKWISFVDSDDFVRNDMYEKLIKHSDCDIVFCKIQVFDNDKYYNINEKYLTKISINDPLKYFYTGSQIINGFTCRCLFKKTLFNTFSFDESVHFCEDSLLMTSIMLSKPKIATVDEYLYYYQITPNSATQARNEDAIKKLYYGRMKIIDLLKKNNLLFYATCYEYDLCILLFRYYVKLNKRLDNLINQFNDKYHYKIYLKSKQNLKNKIKAFITYYKLRKLADKIYKN